MSALPSAVAAQRVAEDQNGTSRPSSASDSRRHRARGGARVQPEDAGDGEADDQPEGAQRQVAAAGQVGVGADREGEEGREGLVLERADQLAAGSAGSRAVPRRPRPATVRPHAACAPRQRRDHRREGDRRHPLPAGSDRGLVGSRPARRVEPHSPTTAKRQPGWWRRPVDARRAGAIAAWLRSYTRMKKSLAPTGAVGPAEPNAADSP